MLLHADEAKPSGDERPSTPELLLEDFFPVEYAYLRSFGIFLLRVLARNGVLLKDERTEHKPDGTDGEVRFLPKCVGQDRGDLR